MKYDKLAFTWERRRLFHQNMYKLVIHNNAIGLSGSSMEVMADQLNIKSKYLEDRIKEYNGYLYRDPEYPNVGPAVFFFTLEELVKFHEEVIDSIILMHKLSGE